MFYSLAPSAIYRKFDTAKQRYLVILLVVNIVAEVYL